MKIEKLYPGVFDRIKANLVDAIFIIALMYSISYLFSQYEDVPAWLRVFAFVFVFALYDPLCISLFGGTLGHMIMELRVCRLENFNKKIIFPLALIRFVIKYILGWVSLVIVFTNKEHRAMHDYSVGSVVVYSTRKQTQLEKRQRFNQA